MDNLGEIGGWCPSRAWEWLCGSAILFLDRLEEPRQKVRVRRA